jgi:hypothetical protein
VNSRASAVRFDLCFVGEFVHEWESAAASTGGHCGGPPGAVVRDRDGDLAVGDRGM